MFGGILFLHIGSSHPSRHPVTRDLGHLSFESIDDNSPISNQPKFEIKAQEVGKSYSARISAFHPAFLAAPKQLE